VTNTSHHKEGPFLYEYPLHWVFLPTETHNRTLLFGTTLLKHSRHFDYWNQPLNTRIRVFYLHCQEAGLYCYLVIHIRNLLRPLQLFYLHLWSIYWLSHVRWKQISLFRRSRWIQQDFSSLRLPTHAMTYPQRCFRQTNNKHLLPTSGLQQEGLIRVQRSLSDWDSL
jgi:hypothetical protein